MVSFEADLRYYGRLLLAGGLVLITLALTLVAFWPVQDSVAFVSFCAMGGIGAIFVGAAFDIHRRVSEHERRTMVVQGNRVRIPDGSVPYNGDDPLVEAGRNVPDHVFQHIRDRLRGVTHREGRPFCPYCGADLSDMQFGSTQCPDCGEVIG